MKSLKIALLLILMSPQAFAGGPVIVTPSGTAGKWEHTALDPVTINPDNDTCGVFSNDQMRTKIADLLEQWTDDSNVDFGFTIGANIDQDVNGSNFLNYTISEPDSTDETDALAINDAFTPVIFDSDGDIIQAVVGGTRAYRHIYGFATPALFTDETYGTFLDGQAVFNCYCVANNPDPTDCGSFSISESQLDFAITHEMGHFIGLDHSNLLSDADIDTVEYSPTMMPFIDSSLSDTIVDNIGAPSTDDIVALASIYPSATFASTHCLVTGTVTNADNEPMRCVDVQAIPSNVESVPADYARSVSFVSGALAMATDNNGDGDTVDSGECSSGCGDFQLYLEPGVSYTIAARIIDRDATGGSSVNPCVNSNPGQRPSCADCDGDTDCIDTCLTETTFGTLPGASCIAGQTIALSAASTATESTGAGDVDASSATARSSSGCALATSAQDSKINFALVMIGFATMIILRKKKNEIL